MADRNHGCDDARYRDRISEYVDGELPDHERDRFAAHLRDCVACRRVASDLSALKIAVDGLPGLEPRRDLWPGVWREMEEAGPFSADWRRSPVKPGSRRGIFLTLPQLAAAVLATVFLSASVGWAAADRTTGVQDEGPTLLSTTFTTEIDGLVLAFEDAATGLTPAARRAVERDLAAIDRSISEASLALRDEPDNAFLQSHLDRSYARKVTTLRDALSIESWSVDE